MSPAGEGAWHRLHPLSPVARVGRRAAALLVVLALPLLSARHGAGRAELVDAALLALAAVAAVVSWLVTRWRVDGSTLRYETGLLRRRTAQVPLTRVQSVDVVRPGTARVLGLAEVRIRSAGARGGDVRLAYLAGERAEVVAAHLLQLARGAAAAVPAVEERQLASVGNVRLLGAVLLRGSTGLVVLSLVGLLLAVLLVPGSRLRGSLVATLLAVTLVVGAGMARHVAGQVGYAVEEAGDGLRVHGGLVGTVSETLPLRRIQALRLTEPLLWRLLGWAGLEADVAGGQRRRGEDRAAAGQLRTLLPVAPRAECLRLLTRLTPGAEAVEVRRPPRIARLDSPLTYHYLGAGVGPHHVVATSGRLRRTRLVVPLAKVQSVRWVQGPLQRRLGLATVHVDVAGSALRPALRHRGGDEARRLAEELPGRCRRARAAREDAGPGTAASA